MSRSSWKGFFLSKSIKKKIKSRSVIIWSRSSAIPASLMNKRVFVHNGNSFRALLITQEKIGLKFGEFSYTRKKINKSSFVKNKKIVKKKTKK